MAAVEIQQRDGNENMNSRERKFLSVWQSGRPWLKYLEDRKVMVCSWTWCTNTNLVEDHPVNISGKFG
jgi:hypothetical protein